jgi:AcrR family transcriptional regulator
MGRPREHDEATRISLIAATERLVAEGGTGAVSVRAVADEAGTTTRAVYSLFGSKEGLVVDALARSAFEFLFTEIGKLEETDDPARDLVDVGVLVVRRLVLEHPGLYRIAFQRAVPGFTAGPELTAARERAWSQLLGKVARLEDARLLRGISVEQATRAFNALMEGLANAELRGNVLRLLPEGREEETWRDALSTLVRGFASPPTKRRSAARPG